MDRKSLRKASNSEVIVDYINTYCEFCMNMNFNRGTKRLGQHWLDLDKEMLERGILTQEQVDRLHM